MHSDIDFDTDISGRGALRARAQTLLEFNVIRERVADRATYFPARQMALGLQPSYDEYEVALLQQETAEGRAVLDESGEVDMYSPDDIGESVVRASIGESSPVWNCSPSRRRSMCMRAPEAASSPCDNTPLCSQT